MFKYDKSKKLSFWSDKTLRTYRDKQKIEDKNVIISTFANEAKIDFKTAIEANGECGIMGTFEVKKNKKE